MLKFDEEHDRAVISNAIALSADRVAYFHDDDPMEKDARSAWMEGGEVISKVTSRKKMPSADGT